MTQVIVRRTSSRNDELYHYGIKGQMWGRRRYQNPDGSLTAAGRKRYGHYIDYKTGAVKDTSKKRYIKTALIGLEQSRIDASESGNKKAVKKIDKAIEETVKKAVKNSYNVKVSNAVAYSSKGRAAMETGGLLGGLIGLVVARGVNSYMGHDVHDYNKYKIKKREDTESGQINYRNDLPRKINTSKKSNPTNINDNGSYSKKTTTQVKKSQPSASKGLSWDDSYKVTKVSDVPKSAKLQFDKHDGVTEVSWLTNDGHIAFGEYDPKTKKIFDVNING